MFNCCICCIQKILFIKKNKEKGKKKRIRLTALLLDIVRLSFSKNLSGGKIGLSQRKMFLEAEFSGIAERELH